MIYPETKLGNQKYDDELDTREDQECICAGELSPGSHWLKDCILEKSCSVPSRDDFVCLPCQCSRRRRRQPAAVRRRRQLHRCCGCAWAPGVLQYWDTPCGPLAIPAVQREGGPVFCWVVSMKHGLASAPEGRPVVLTWQHTGMPTACHTLAHFSYYYYFVCGIFFCL